MDTYPEIIPFRERVNGGSTISRRGYQIGKSLAVSHASTTNQSAYRIYNVWSGKPTLPNRFLNLADALEVARNLDTVYGEYWEISQVYPDMDIIAVARWSVNLGVQLHLALSSLEYRDTISVADIRSAFVEAAQPAKEMITRYVRP